MKRVFYFLVALFCGAALECDGSQVYNRYKKAFDAFFLQRTDASFDAFAAAYDELLSSKYTLPGERLAAQSFFELKMGTKQGIQNFINKRLEEREEDEEKRVAAEKRKTVSEKDLIETSHKTTEEPHEASTVDKAKLENIRKQIRLDINLDGIEMKAGDHSILTHVERVFKAYESAKQLVELSKDITDKNDDIALRKDCARALWKLFVAYAGADGKSGDAVGKKKLREPINSILVAEGLPEWINSEFIGTNETKMEDLD